LTYKIVVGVDGSPHGNAALRWAVEHAVALDGAVTAVFAWQIPVLGMPGAFDRDELEKMAKDFLTEAVSSIVPSPPVPLWTVVAEGDATEALITASAEADLLVLGSRGRNPFKGLLLGSVCQGCAANTNCPVTIVKIPSDVGG
jgi:nucleotide-binding universal stress UspA family protein